jgi:hypothetical protein
VDWPAHAREASLRGNTAPYSAGTLKLRLTLRFYCGKEGCSEAWIRWRAAQIILFCLERQSRALQQFVALGRLRSERLRASRHAL